MRDTSQNLVINKQTVHPIKTLTSPYLSPSSTHSVQCSYQSISNRKDVSLGLGLTSSPPPCLPYPAQLVVFSVLCFQLPVWASSRAPMVWAFIFHSQVQITRLGLCTCRHAKCHICCGFVNSAHLVRKMMKTSWSYNLLCDCWWGKCGKFPFEKGYVRLKVAANMFRTGFCQKNLNDVG